VTQKLVLDFWYLADPFPQILTRKYDCASVAECEKRLFSHKIFFLRKFTGREAPTVVLVYNIIKSKHCILP
jgi:hypothetical protein